MQNNFRKKKKKEEEEEEEKEANDHSLHSIYWTSSN
jgi:hypothetical protein